MVFAVIFLLSICHGCLIDNGHFYLYFTNNSSDTVVVARRVHYNEKCNLSGTEVAPGQTLACESGRDSWEIKLSDNKTCEIFIVDPKIFNKPLEFYTCDSVPIKNRILHGFSLSLDDLIEKEFKLSYP
jgi:hypothetical protein